jgi:ribosome-associated protein
MLIINQSITLTEHEVQLTAIRSQGAGGQNVNKVSSAIHLRFDIQKSSLPQHFKRRLLNSNDSRINKQCVIVIKAQQWRTQEKNRQEALSRLRQLILKETKTVKIRRKRKPSKAAKQKRLDNKSHRSRVKSLRGKISHR